METLEIALDENGNKVVVLPDIIFSNKQNIDWNEVEKYLERFVGELEKTSQMNMPVQSIQGKRKAAGQRRKLMRRRVFVRWWRLPQIKGSGKTRKRNIPVMPQMAGITIQQGLPCRFMIMT